MLLLLHLPAVDDGRAGRRVACAVVGGAPDEAAAAEQLLVELLPEGSAQQVQGERVDAGVGEGQDTSGDAEQEVRHGRVHLQGRLRSVTNGEDLGSCLNERDRLLQGSRCVSLPGSSGRSGTGRGRDSAASRRRKDQRTPGPSSPNVSWIPSVGWREHLLDFRKKTLILASIVAFIK